MNLGRLEQLIGQLDQPSVSQEIHIVAVRHAAASEVAQKLTEIAQAQASSRPGPTAAAVPARATKVLADERTNKLIVIAGEKAFEALLDLVKQLDVPTGDGVVHVLALHNAKAEDLATTLQSLSQGTGGKRHGSSAPPAVPGAAPSAPVSAELFSGEVKITADKSRNALIVIANQADYRGLVKLVEQLDTPQRQVFVEAVILEVNLQDDRDVGVSFHGGEQRNVDFAGNRGSATGVVGTNLGGLSSIAGLSSLASLNGFLGGIQGPPITVGGLTVPSFGMVLQALQSSSDVNVISTPHVIMTDNTEGEIVVGQNVPFQAAFAPNTGTTTPTATSLGSLYAPIQRQNVELKLLIRPQINEGDLIHLEVEQQTEEIASVDKTLGPTTSKRSAKTTVVARDQETIVLGGLIQERTTRSVSKVPVLGSLPFLGWLFRSESTKKQRTNLLLFLTPYIIQDQGDVRRIFERKMAEREEFVRRFYGDDPEMRRFIDYDHKPGPLARIHRGIAEELAKIENGGAGTAGERLVGSQ